MEDQFGRYWSHKGWAFATIGSRRHDNDNATTCQGFQDRLKQDLFPRWVKTELPQRLQRQGNTGIGHIELGTPQQFSVDTTTTMQQCVIYSIGHAKAKPFPRCVKIATRKHATSCWPSWFTLTRQWWQMSSSGKQYEPGVTVSQFFLLNKVTLTSRFSCHSVPFWFIFLWQKYFHLFLRLHIRTLKCRFQQIPRCVGFYSKLCVKVKLCL